MDTSVATQKFGPLAVWQWGLIAGGGWVAFSWWRGRNASSSADGADTTDPNAFVDPNNPTVFGAGGTDQGSNIPTGSGDSGDLPPIEVHIDAPPEGWPAPVAGPVGPAGPAGHPGCNAGFHWDPKTGKCVKDKGGHGCTSPRPYWDPHRKVCSKCKPGTTWNGKKCVPVKAKTHKVVTSQTVGGRSRVLAPPRGATPVPIGGRVSAPGKTVAHDARFTFGATQAHVPHPAAPGHPTPKVPAHPAPTKARR